MGTTVARWGNSSGVRIPSKVLKASRFKLGDIVDVIVNAHGNIEIVPSGQGHRLVTAPKRMTAEKLYEMHPIADAAPAESPWPNDDMVGAEWESWSR